jgi:hypothetical protein
MHIVHRFFSIFCLEECAHIVLQRAAHTTRDPEAPPTRQPAQDHTSLRRRMRKWLDSKVKQAWQKHVLHCKFRKPTYVRIASSRLTYAIRLTAASLLALYLGNVMVGSGLWAATAVSVMGPRESVRGGSIFRVGLLRVTGTVVGSMWGYVVGLIAGGQGQLVGLQIILFAVSHSHARDRLVLPFLLGWGDQVHGMCALD